MATRQPRAHRPQQPSTHVNKPQTDRRSVCDVALFIINDAFRFKDENITMELNLEKNDNMSVCKMFEIQEVLIITD